MQSFLIMQGFIYKVSLLCSAKYIQVSLLYVVLYIQSVLIIQCFICKVSLLCSARYIQSVLIICSALYTKCPYYVVLYIQSVLLVRCSALQNVTHCASLLRSAQPGADSRAGQVKRAPLGCTSTLDLSMFVRGACI